MILYFLHESSATNISDMNPRQLLGTAPILKSSQNNLIPCVVFIGDFANQSALRHECKPNVAAAPHEKCLS